MEYLQEEVDVEHSVKGVFGSRLSKGQKLVFPATSELDHLRRAYCGLGFGQVVQDPNQFDAQIAEVAVFRSLKANEFS
jgi:hypothetical protein